MDILNPQRLQGWLFCAAAAGVTGLSLLLPRLEPQTELVIIAGLILMLGVPHGALDTEFARKLYGVASWRSWLGFTVVYFVPAIVVIAIWQFAPTLFLVGFLVLSIAHFSGDPPQGTPVVTRIVYGGATIILPLLLHADEVTRLFAILVGDNAAISIVESLSWVVWPWAGAVGLLAAHRMRTDILSGLELGALGLLATVAPPLIAFAVYFCLMHSARHILRTTAFISRVSLAQVLSSTIAPMLVTLCLAIAAWIWLEQSSLDARLVQLIFVGLAALTVPHMLIVERVRLAGWNDAQTKDESSL